MDLAVIIPCRNEAATLAQQLDALASQAWSGTWEVIVVDNGSDDDTAAIAAGHRGLAGRLRVIDASEKPGIATARRCGVEASTAAAFVFCDGDDVVAPGWVAAMGEALNHHQLVTGEIEIDALNAPEVTTSRGRHAMGVAPKFAGTPFLRGNNCGLTRSAWEQLDGFDESFKGLEDIELSLRAAAAGMATHFVPEALVQYRYRTEFPKLWRQGKYYGASFVLLGRRCRDLGLPRPARKATIRSWAWLVLNLPRAPMRRYRYRWVWTLACRTGALRTVLSRG